MNKWAKKSLVALAVAGALGITSGVAQATALADSILDLTNLTFNNHVAGTGIGTILVNGVNITVIAFDTTGQALSQLTSFTSQNSGVLVGPPLDIGDGGAGGAQICSGSAAACGQARLANNAFAVFSSGIGDPAAAGTVAQADQLEVGSPINGISGLTSPAHIGNSSVTSINATTASGASSSNNTLTAQFSFIVDVSGIVDIDFNARAYLEAFVAPGIGSANASYAQRVTITDVTAGNVTVFDWAPNGLGSITGGVSVLDPFSLNANVGASGPVGGTQFVGASLGVANSGHFQAETPVLIAQHIYTFAANTDTNARARETHVPEPGVLLLVGAGLLGLWGTRRRSLNG